LAIAGRAVFGGNGGGGGGVNGLADNMAAARRLRACSLK